MKCTQTYHHYIYGLHNACHACQIIQELESSYPLTSKIPFKALECNWTKERGECYQCR